MKFFYILLLNISFFVTQAQQGGRGVYSFLNLTTSSKQASLGGENYTGLNNDIFQVLSNPATLDSTMINQVGLSYVNYLSTVNYGNLVYAIPINNWGVFFGGLQYLNYGAFQYADENGNRSGKFGAGESALILGYAYHFPKSNFNIGINTKFIYSSLESYTSIGVAADIGFFYSNHERGTEIGLSFRNLGTQITTYNGIKEKLPFEIDAGFSRLLAYAPLKWHITFENIQKFKIAYINPSHTTQDPNGNEIDENITLVDHLFRHIILGAEIFPRKKFTFRLGYNFRRKAELSQVDQNFISNINFGFGLKLRKFEINYAYAKYHYATNAHFFTAIINLNEF